MENNTMSSKYVIVRDYGIINKRTDALGNKWIKRVRFISWNDQKPLLDIREWSDDDATCRTGMRLNWREVDALEDLLVKIKEEQQRVGKEDRAVGEA